MAEDPRPSEPVEAPPAANRLDSWKEIAAYLLRDVTTVRRWEKLEGLPVHRHLHNKLGSVYAHPHEIDRWWEKRSGQLGERARGTPGRERVAWLLAAGSLGVASLAAGALFVVHGTGAIRDREYRFAISPPDSETFGALAVSPDGRHVAFTAAGPNGLRLWVRPLESLTARVLPGTEDAAFPFWAPDSRFIGFFAQGKLKRIDVTEGSPQTVCDAPVGRGGTWSREDVILFAPAREGPLFRVSASGGVPIAVTTVDPTLHRGHLWPEFLPDGQRFLYLADSTRSEDHGIYAGALNQTAPKRLLTVQSNATYSDGYLFYASGRALLAQRLDTRGLELGSEKITVAEQVVQPYSVDHKGDFSASLTSVLAYRDGGSLLNHLVWVNRRGEPLGIVGGDSSGYTEPVLSPDGTLAAVSIFSRHSPVMTSDLWLLYLANGGLSRFTFDSAADFEPVWSPDGARIVFASNRRGTVDLYQRRTRGTDSEELLLESEQAKHPEDWSPDGRFLVYSSFDAKTKFDLWILSMDGQSETRPYLRTEFSEGQGQISPDGRWLAYTSNESGRLEVFVRPFPVPDGKQQISSAGGADPRWRRDGGELFYIATDGKLMAVTVKTDRIFEAGVPQPLFDTNVRDLWEDARNHYDVSADGARFLIARPVENLRSLPITVVGNWRPGLRQ